MSAAVDLPGMDLIRQRFFALREALKTMPSEADRRIALDALRNALDRGCEEANEAGIVANSFAILRELQRSPNFAVLLVRQRDLGTLHALKTPVPERGTDPLLRRLILSEATHQARVRHPACLPLAALLRMPDGRPALLTDHVEAPTLADVLRRRSLGEGEAVALGVRLARALQAVHSAGLVHGDVTPANVFLPRDEPGAAILFDFGLSREIGSGETVDDCARACSPAFAAPEAQAIGASAAPGSDLYSLGRLLMAAVSVSGPKLAALLARLQHDDPARRGQSAAAVARELESCGFEDTT